MTHQQETFIIDDLLNELQIYVKAELQTAGKPEIDVEIYHYSDEHICSIFADRECLRQVLIHLLDNAVKFAGRGFIVFGYHLLDDNVVDFFVDDTRKGNNDDAVLDLSAVRDLLQTMGSRLKVKPPKRVGSSFSFSIKSEQVELTKLA